MSKKILFTPKIGLILVTLIVITIGIYFRLYPVTHNIRNQNLNATRLAAYINLRKSLKESVDISKPGLSEIKKRELIDAKFKEIINKDSANLNKMLSKIPSSNNNSLFKFYLLESDPYHYYYLTKRLLEKGNLSETRKNGKYLDMMMMAPMGFWRNIEIHPYIGLFVYKIFKFFDNKIPLLISLATVPLVFFVLSIILFITVCIYLRIDIFSIFVSCIFFGLAPIFIQRSTFGWFDTDPYNVMFFIMAIFISIIAIKNNSNIKWTILLSFISSLYSLFWQGWIFLPASIILLFVLFIVKDIFSKNPVKSTLKKLFIYIIFVALFSSVFLTPRGFLGVILDQFGISSTFLSLSKDVWPDIFVTVGELNIPTLSKIIQILGGYVFIIIALIGALFLFFDKKKHYSHETKVTIIFYLIITFALAKGAERFTIFFLVPASVCLAIGCSKILALLKNVFSSLSENRNSYAKFLAYPILLLLVISPFVYGHVSASNQNPIFNQVWEKSLDKIRLETPKDSIINSWWCPGHFIKAIGERRVTFDGATMNTPQAYWVATAFLADNEKESVGIFRMLNNSGNRATELLLSNGIALEKAVDIIKKVVTLDKIDARYALSEYLNEAKIDELLKLTHDTPPPSYIFIYNDLIESTIGLYYIKNWDFVKAKTLNAKRMEELKKGNLFWRGSKDNISYIWSISGGMTYIGEESYETTRTKDILYFGNGVMLNLPAMEARLTNFNKNLSGPVQSIIYIENNDLVKKSLQNSIIKLSVLFIKKTSGPPSTIIAPESILSSILYRLYYLNGIGFKHFQLFSDNENPVLNTKIIVYKIDWTK